MDEDTDEHLGPEERSLRDAFVRSITDMLDAEPYLRTYKTSAFPLLLFVWLRSIEGVERMLELGFYADANEDIWTGLYFACLKGHDRIVSLLLQRGAEPSRKSRRGTNALMVAAEGGHVRTVDLLLQHKGQVGIVMPILASPAAHDASADCSLMSAGCGRARPAWPHGTLVGLLRGPCRRGKVTAGEGTGGLEGGRRGGRHPRGHRKVQGAPVVCSGDQGKASTGYWEGKTG